MHFDIPRLSTVSDDLLHVAIGPKSWNQVLNDLMAATNSDGATIIPATGRELGHPCSDSLALPLERYYNEGWAERDYRLRAIPLAMRRKVVIDSDFMSDDDYNNEFFRFMNCFNLKYTALVIFRIDGNIVCCALHRKKDKGGFSPQEGRALTGLSERFTLASSIAHSVADAKVMGLSEAFDRMNLGVIFFNRAGRVARMNGAAERLMGEDLSVTRGEIRAGSSEETNALRKQIHITLSGLETPYSQVGIRITRREKRPLIVRTQRIDGFLQDFFYDIKAMAVIEDLGEQPQGKASVLQSAFNLTPTQAAIAMLLAEGGGLKDVADQRHISYETARTHMKSLLSKMGARGQSEIVSLVTKIR